MTDSDSAARVRIELNRIDELFTSPRSAPLEGEFEERSGIERLRDLVHADSVPLDIEIALPHSSGKVDPAPVHAAIRGYCDQQIAHIDRKRARVHRLGRKELFFGLLFLAVCLALSAATAALPLTPAWFGQFVSEGLIIIGWIALWHPVDMLFFDRLPLVRDQRVLRRIQLARIHIDTKEKTPHG